MRIILKGTVQGVGFRPAVYRVANTLSLNGHVKNMGSEVEVVIDGDPEEFLDELKRELPPLAEITSVDFFEYNVDEKGFSILSSSEGGRSSTLPVDTALCNDCLEEMRTDGDRRKDYPFTNCTNCGARFTAIYSLPYDREKTTMQNFPMCEDCKKEYEDPTDRRFHAQTTSCPKCGPRYILYNSSKEKIGGVDEFCELIKDGEIGIAKSWGGMHIVCKLEEIPRLRDIYGRPEKPFALMMPDVETVMKYAHIERKDVLEGPRRPIMIYNKKDHRKELLEYAAPGLPTIGIMLPYTGLHFILFDKMDVEGLVMTSANPPGEPMVIENEKAFELGFEYNLLHDRKIANRVDDSLIRVHGEDLALIRRSRGYVPEYLDFLPGEVMAAGADQSGCVAFSRDGKIYPSQYLGDLDSYGASQFYKDAADHLISMLGITDVKGVGLDLHPRYRSKKMGEEYAERFDCERFEIQHHWAHGASLLLEHDLEEIVCISIDGTGYGTDGGSWGGEILYCTGEDFKRTAHLETFPLLGGEKAVEDPRRLVYAIQRKFGMDGEFFNGNEASVLDKLMKKSVKTSSFGRLLDALSCSLGVCCSRTYEGEPAMKLEKLQMEGDEVIEYDVKLERGEILTLEPFLQMMSGKERKRDKAASYTSQISQKLADAAVYTAEDLDVNNIGVSGGVSYNRPIVESIRKRLETHGYELFVHHKIPNGDMGIPLGQAYIVANKTR
ncbi:MAG: carbamoyltransferase HypF [Candidatus Saliniplasma sp.]